MVNNDDTNYSSSTSRSHIPEETSLRHLAPWERAGLQNSVIVTSSLAILPSSLPSDGARKSCV